MMGRNLLLLSTLLLLFCLEFNAAARNRQSSSRRFNRAGRGGRRGSQALVVTDETRDSSPPMVFRRISEVREEAETTQAPPPPIFKQWLELESAPLPKTSVKLHSDVYLECTAVGSPPPSIYWLKDERPIQDVATFDAVESLNGMDFRRLLQPKSPIGFAMSKVKSKLPLRCIRPEDEGKYTCVAENDGKELMATTLVAIEEDDRSSDLKPECEFRVPVEEFIGKKPRRGTPAYIFSSESIHMEAIGNDILLPCRVGGKPSPRLTWTNTEGQLIPIGKKFQINSRGDLVIKNLSWSEMGEYTCAVENAYGSEASATFVYPLLGEKK